MSQLGSQAQQLPAVPRRSSTNNPGSVDYYFRRHTVSALVPPGGGVTRTVTSRVSSVRSPAPSASSTLSATSSTGKPNAKLAKQQHSEKRIQGSEVEFKGLKDSLKLTRQSHERRVADLLKLSEFVDRTSWMFDPVDFSASSTS